jgi:hypothetical protein
MLLLLLWLMSWLKWWWWWWRLRNQEQSDTVQLLIAQQTALDAGQGGDFVDIASTEVAGLQSR